MVRREAHAVDQNLSFVERAEITGLRIAEADDAVQLVVDGIGHRDGVGELLRGIDAVAMGDRNVWIGCRSRRLAGTRCRLPCQADAGEKTQRQKTAPTAPHVSPLFHVHGTVRYSSVRTRGGRRRAGLRWRRHRWW